MGRPKKIITQPIKEEPKSIIEVVNNSANLEIKLPIEEPPVKLKRGRKPNKPAVVNSITESSINNIICEIKEISNESINTTDLNLTDFETATENKSEKTPLKKRGRKPKGGKIIQQITPTINTKETKPNIILHLKCFTKDLKHNLFNNNLNGFNFDNKTELTYDIISSSNINSDINSYETFHNNNNNPQKEPISRNCITDDDSIENNLLSIEINNNFKETREDKENNNIKEVWKKLKVLENNLHINNISDKKSACFWCTYDFDSPCIYIPKHFLKDSYHVYGCFCSPECATAYLMEENIDTSSKFERYHLLNHIYSKIYDYKKNIKPAPNPLYMLDKFYGNLNIHEYRSLLKSERLFLVVDKPLTRILPELHEDNDDFIINNKIIPSNTYQIKKKLVNKNLTKTSILNEKFGLSQ
jgi:hypothetical protein